MTDERNTEPLSENVFKLKRETLRVVCGLIAIGCLITAWASVSVDGHRTELAIKQHERETAQANEGKAKAEEGRAMWEHMHEQLVRTPCPPPATEKKP